MKYIRYAIWAVIAIALVAVALGNRQPVELTLLPEGLADIFAFNTGITLPLYAVIFGGIVVGLLIGFLWAPFVAQRQSRREAFFFQAHQFSRSFYG